MPIQGFAELTVHCIVCCTALEILMVRPLLYITGWVIFTVCVLIIGIKVFTDQALLQGYDYSFPNIVMVEWCLLASLGLLAAARIITLLENIETKLGSDEKKVVSLKKDLGNWPPPTGSKENHA